MIENVFENNILEHFNAIMMEWHKEGSCDLISMLHQKGFTVFDFPDNTDYHTGMIYAVKKDT